MAEFRKKKLYLNKPVSIKVINKVKKIQLEHKKNMCKGFGKKKPKPLYFYEALEILIRRNNK